MWLTCISVVVKVLCVACAMVYESRKMLIYKVHHHHHQQQHHHHHQQQQQQTASPNHSVAHTGVKEGGGRCWIKSIRLPSAGLITLIDRRVRPGGTLARILEDRRGGDRRVVPDDTQKKVCGRMRKFRAGIDGHTPTVLALYRSNGSGITPGSPSTNFCDQMGSAHGKMTIKFVVIFFTLLLAQGAR